MDSYNLHRAHNTNISGAIVITAATDDQTLVTVRGAKHTLYIQQVIAYITTDAAQSWAFTDSAGNSPQVVNLSGVGR
jgi:hypothetical protein